MCAHLSLASCVTLGKSPLKISHHLKMEPLISISQGAQGVQWDFVLEALSPVPGLQESLNKYWLLSSLDLESFCTPVCISEPIFTGLFFSLSTSSHSTYFSCPISDFIHLLLELFAMHVADIQKVQTH